MVVAVVRDEFAASLTEQLAQKGFGATKLASTGAFFKAGNSTFLIGVPTAQLDEVMGLIKVGVTPKKVESKPGADKGSGATVFVMDVAKMIKV